jgi:hypothetical protein
LWELRDSASKDSSYKEKFREVHFSPSGNLESVIFYNDMLPILLENYGYLDGRRVYKSQGLINYRFSKVPGEKLVTKHIAKNGDPRYESEIDYLYDNQGRLTEVNVWDSAGVWQFQKIAVYDHASVTWNTYGNKHKLTSKHFLVHDDKGDVTQENTFNSSDKLPVFKTRYDYVELDAFGNWVKRIARTELSSTQNVEIVEYRSFTYYE